MRRGNWRGVAEYIKANGDRGDVVIPDGDYNVMLLGYYLDSERDDFVIKKAVDPLVPQVIPFRVFYFQHDYQMPDSTINFDELFITSYEKAISFKADISPMHLIISHPIYFWQEAEDPVSNIGWSVLNFYGQKLIRIDTADLSTALISYKLSVPEEGWYSLYANLRLDNSPGMLSYRLDNGVWSNGFQPQFHGTGGRTEESKLGVFYLDSSEHELFFRNKAVNNSGHDQAIDYFYLTKDN